MTLDPVSSGDPHVPAHNSERDAINALQAQMDTKIPLPPGAAVGDLLRWDGSEWLTTETRFFEGEGAPNGAFAAPVGSRYIDKLATNGVVEWVKRTGGESNTGWISLVGDSGWIEVGQTGNPPFLNSWTNLGGQWTTAAFRKFNNVVYLKGLMTRPTSRAFVAFQLPAGFRPHADTHIATYVGGNTTVDQYAVNIYKTTGNVTGRPPTAGLMSLDGISFPADN